MQRTLNVWELSLHGHKAMTYLASLQRIVELLAFLAYQILFIHHGVGGAWKSAAVPLPSGQQDVAQGIAN